MPRGGRRILPDFRVVAYYGAPQAKALGELGIGTPAHAAAKLMKQADAGMIPVMENGNLLGTVTDRDIAIRLVAEGKDPQSTTVREIAARALTKSLRPMHVDDHLQSIGLDLLQSLGERDRPRIPACRPSSNRRLVLRRPRCACVCGRNSWR